MNAALQRDGANRCLAAGSLAVNLVRFGRLLRAAGLAIGPERVLRALEAARLAGVERRDDFYWALATVFLDRREQLELYDRAFRAFWREPGGAPLPRPPGLRRRAAQRRAGAALGAGVLPAPDSAAGDPRPAARGAALAASRVEALRTVDFERMSPGELAAAQAAVAALRFALAEVRTRRAVPSARGRSLDARASLRAAVRGSSEIIPLRRADRRRRAPPLVALVDVSGSMDRYTRMFVHLLHALARGIERVSAFTFGTRLTHVTRAIRARDPGEALERIARSVSDWSGGTRIGACLGEFNRRWSRRLLGPGATVLLVSDGLECGDSAELAREIERLHKSCRRLIWLNPLLRHPGFEPRALGIRAMLPHVDALLPAHDLRSLERLAGVLARPHARARPRRPLSGYHWKLEPRAPGRDTTWK